MEEPGPLGAQLPRTASDLGQSRQHLQSGDVVFVLPRERQRVAPPPKMRRVGHHLEVIRLTWRHEPNLGASVMPPAEHLPEVSLRILKDLLRQRRDDLCRCLRLGG